MPPALELAGKVRAFGGDLGGDLRGDRGGGVADLRGEGVEEGEIENRTLLPFLTSLLLDASAWGSDAVVGLLVSLVIGLPLVSTGLTFSFSFRCGILSFGCVILHWKKVVLNVSMMLANRGNLLRISR